MRIVHRIREIIVAGMMMVWLLPASVEAAGETHALGYDVIGQVEKVLKEAALNSP